MTVFETGRDISVGWAGRARLVGGAHVGREHDVAHVRYGVVDELGRLQLVDRCGPRRTP